MFKRVTTAVAHSKRVGLNVLNKTKHCSHCQECCSATSLPAALPLHAATLLSLPFLLHCCSLSLGGWHQGNCYVWDLTPSECHAKLKLEAHPFSYVLSCSFSPDSRYRRQQQCSVS